MLKFEANLVGMHFRPPAKDVVNLLASNTELEAVRQPLNQYDENAISVVLHGFCQGGQHEKIWRPFYDEAVASDNPDEALAQLVDPLPLGFICNGEKTGGKKADLIAPQMDAAEMPSVPCKLSFNEKGGPMVVIEAEFTPKPQEPKAPPIKYEDPNAHAEDHK